ncbi:uncharacterized protein LOC126834748 [Adelges cooleyi]|uniref:uncharacterized protein LOC126834748 n=1 Tax=Adelges cooleyi TaxID=133065 RepID=UPI00217F3193|nr:uncharacterized protein LOC126834748 [Adelges cooleyi]
MESNTEPMCTDEPMSSVTRSCENMNISVAFKEITLKDPPRFTKLRDAVNNTFGDIVNSVSLEEFKQLLGDISFLKNKQNMTRLFSTLKTNIHSTMSQQFDVIVQDENVPEIFAKKNELTKEEAEKYIIDDDSLKIMELEESLVKLNRQIAELEESNDILFNQEKFNKQRYNQLLERLDKLLDSCKTQYADSNEQINLIQNEFANLLGKPKYKD